MIDRNKITHIMHRKILQSAFIASIRVMAGYISMRFAFGLLIVSSGYPWFLALIMPVIIYAGAAQFKPYQVFSLTDETYAILTYGSGQQ